MSNQQTAKIALSILIKNDASFEVPDAKARKHLAMAFAGDNKVIYGKAFDIVKKPKNLDLQDFSVVEKRLKEITLYEVKSTKKKDVTDDFCKYFFGISTAELLVAQSLKKQFKFVFVNINNENCVELELKELFAKAKGIYPSWSIQF